MICIECPIGCVLSVEVDNGHVVKVEGNKCPRGKTYAESEVENPLRILTTTVLAEGLSLKMVAVRTDKAIPKSKLIQAMEETRKIRLVKDVSSGEIIVENFLGLGVNLVATRGTRE